MCYISVRKYSTAKISEMKAYETKQVFSVLWVQVPQEVRGVETSALKTLQGKRSVTSKELFFFF